ncbi:ATP-binding protein [Microbispora sp. KK1-11]|uniref:ATP-binding protein n=1 Tax=Microbispora sp. KK1-11 TaxID=2053005 RepID=UPI001157CE4D|nr:ATP-binding protein [Microbispora sp. KK1-11]TQS29307.1 ATP-binding protein [Microbispora sp. KK1-11]
MLISPFPSQEGRRTAYKVFGSAATAPRRARAFVRCQLRGWELADLAETAELVVSELVTNAVRATDAVVSPPVASSMFPVALRTVALRVRVAPGRRSLFIEVWDVSDREPVPHDEEAGELRESGRGLSLVGSLARRWGHYSAPDRGKIVWCELAISPVEGPRPPGSAGAPAAGSGPRGRPAAEALTGALPRRVRRHPVGARADGPDEATLLRVLEGLRALDVSGPDRR